MLPANLAPTFEAIQTQSNFVETVTSVHSAHVTSAHSAPITSLQTESGITLYAPHYILSAPIPTIDEVFVAPVSTTPRVLKPIEFIKPFDNDLNLCYTYCIFILCFFSEEEVNQTKSF